MAPLSTNWVDADSDNRIQTRLCRGLSSEEKGNAQTGNPVSVRLIACPVFKGLEENRVRIVARQEVRAGLPQHDSEG